MHSLKKTNKLQYIWVVLVLLAIFKMEGILAPGNVVGVQPLKLPELRQIAKMVNTALKTINRDNWGNDEPMVMICSGLDSHIQMDQVDWEVNSLEMGWKCKLTPNPNWMMSSSAI